jgi:hypothetical protein
VKPTHPIKRQRHSHIRMQRRHAVAELGYQRTVRRRAYAVREVRTVRAEEGRVVAGVGGEEGVVDERFGAEGGTG